MVKGYIQSSEIFPQTEEGMEIQVCRKVLINKKGGGVN